jgi:tRNA-dihydrouridine synthase
MMDSEAHHSSLSKSRPILNGRVNFPLCLAPMVGISHVALRMVAREYLPAGAFTIWPTEMLNSRRIPDEILEDTPEAFRHESETGLVPQILGNEEKCIRESVQKLEIWGAEGIDINMGCPVQKALRHNYGVALMGDANYAAQVVAMTKKSAKVPVSVKLRAGKQGDFGYLENFVQGLIGTGADWITLHPRTAEQKRRGRADWSQIRMLREKVSVPVIGNGDIQTAADVLQMQNETGADLVMAGRALAARPWMFWQLGEKLGWAPPSEEKIRCDQNGLVRGAPKTAEEEGAEYGRSLLRLLEIHEQFLPTKPDLVMRKMRFHIRMTSVWLMFGQSVISLASKSRTPEELRSNIREFFSRPVEMSAKTDLRE